MTQKRTYKVLASIPKHDGSGDWFMKVGSGYTNRDDSINLYIDAIPTHVQGRGMRLQIRELDAEDLARREAYRSGARPQEPVAASASERVPF